MVSGYGHGVGCWGRRGDNGLDVEQYTAPETAGLARDIEKSNCIKEIGLRRGLCTLL